MGLLRAATAAPQLRRSKCPFNPLRPHQPQLCRIYQTASPLRLQTGHVQRSLPSIYSTLNRNRRHRRSLRVMATQSRSHSGGGHSHHSHSHDNVYLTSQNKNDAGVRITRIGLYSNLGMAIAKGAGGYVFNSQAMIADAWHSMTDLASDVLTLATVSWSLKPPTVGFPGGFGKVESLGSLGVSGMLLGGGLFMFMSSFQTLYAHLFLDPAAAAEALAHGHGHSHGHDHLGPSLHAVWLAAGTVVIKEWLYHASKALHLLVEALTS